MFEPVKAGLLTILFCACTSTSDPNAPQTFSFGPFSIPASYENSSECVQITLHNSSDLYINAVDLETGPGFHHSNWLWVGVAHRLSGGKTRVGTSCVPRTSR